MLPPEDSLALREQLVAELGAFTEAEALTTWAGLILPRKNQLATSDARAVETAFAAKLDEFLATGEQAERSAPDVAAAGGTGRVGGVWGMFA